MNEDQEKRDEAVREIEDAVEAIYEALDQIKQALKPFPGAYERARSYWMAHIDGALLNRHGWLGGSFISAESTLDELRRDDNENDE